MPFFNVFASVRLTQVIREGNFFPTGNFYDLCLVLSLDRIGLSKVPPPLPGSAYCQSLLDYVFNLNLWKQTMMDFHVEVGKRQTQPYF